MLYNSKKCPPLQMDGIFFYRLFTFCQILPPKIGEMFHISKHWQSFISKPRATLRTISSAFWLATKRTVSRFRWASNNLLYPYCFPICHRDIHQTYWLLWGSTVRARNSGNSHSNICTRKGFASPCHCYGSLWANCPILL